MAKQKSGSRKKEHEIESKASKGERCYTYASIKSTLTAQKKESVIRVVHTEENKESRRLNPQATVSNLQNRTNRQALKMIRGIGGTGEQDSIAEMAGSERRDSRGTGMSSIPNMSGAKMRNTAAHDRTFDSKMSSIAYYSEFVGQRGTLVGQVAHDTYNPVEYPKRPQLLRHQLKLKA